MLFIGPSFAKIINRNSESFWTFLDTVTKTFIQTLLFKKGDNVAFYVYDLVINFPYTSQQR